jgi:folate-binding protein YgfZ
MMRLRRQVGIAPEPSLAVFADWPAPADMPADPRLPAAGARHVAAPDLTTTATLADWHAHRLPLGLAEADEIGTDELLWLETNARELDGVSFTKGCFTGQENTARMHYRDRLRKRLLPLKGDPAMGDAPIMAGGGGGSAGDAAREAGQWRGRWHGNLRMALIRMEHAQAALRCAGQPVTLISPSWLPQDEPVG